MNAGSKTPRVAAGVLVVALTGLTVTPAHAAGPEFTIRSNDITESSGLATQRAAERYWTVDDGDTSGRAYALKPDGSVEGVLRWNAPTQNLEAVFFDADAGRLWAGDIGDNRSQRAEVVVYAINQPAPGRRSYRAYDLTYPDGPHDAEAMFVRQGRLYVVTKALRGGIYRAPRDLSASGTNRLERVADAPAFVTDATVDGRGRPVLRTYLGAYVLDDKFAVTASAPTPFQPQGESITMALDGKRLLVGSEGRNSQVLAMPVPGGLARVEQGGATPPPSPAAEPDEKADENAGGERNGTIAAIAAALAAAVAAGLVAHLLSRPRAERGVRRPPNRFQRWMHPENDRDRVSLDEDAPPVEPPAPTRAEPVAVAPAPPPSRREDAAARPEPEPEPDQADRTDRTVHQTVHQSGHQSGQTPPVDPNSTRRFSPWAPPKQ